jgi:hypothetical protein
MRCWRHGAARREESRKPEPRRVAGGFADGRPLTLDSASRSRRFKQWWHKARRSPDFCEGCRGGRDDRRCVWHDFHCLHGLCCLRADTRSQYAATDQ